MEMGAGLRYCNLTEDRDGAKRLKGVTLFAIRESAQTDQSQRKEPAVDTEQNSERIHRGVVKLLRE
jgi:hypothetical protein